MPPDAFPAHGVNEFCDYQSGDPQMEIGTVLLIMISPCEPDDRSSTAKLG
jgi:hypothetical protein